MLTKWKRTAVRVTAALFAALGMIYFSVVYTLHEGLMFEEGCPPVVCKRVNLFSSNERFRDAEGDKIPYYDLSNVQPGDILVTMSNHTLGYRHGHSGLVVGEGKTLEAVYLGKETEKPILVLGSRSAYKKALSFKNYHNYVEFPPHTEWSDFGLKFSSVKAEHSDFEAIGVIIEDGDKKYYITGDTLYNEDIFKDIPDDIYALFLPINGLGNNMNKTDAARFAKKVAAKFTVPFHVGMFDEFTAEDFECENKIIPEIYKEIKFN